MGMTDFFTMEAGDYLERLDALVSQPTPPDAADFVRLSRALRGSAIMANQQAIGMVAGGLEGLSRGLADERIPWDEASRQLAIRAVDDLKVLVRAARDWSDADEARARQIGTELERFAGRPTVPRRAPAEGLDPGTRAFIAREAATIANALHETARALEANPMVTDHLDAVSRAMRPLRGIASLSEVPPLPDLLEGIDRAVGELLHPGGAAPGPELFDRAATAVSEVAQQITAGQEGIADTESARRFAELLGELMDADSDVVPIESLYYADDGPHIVEQGNAQGVQQLGRLELVSHLEYLRQAADQLEQAQTPTQRALRAHALPPTLRVLATAAGGPLATAAAAFAQAARQAIASGAAVADPVSFAQRLREASQTLSEAAQGAAAHAPNRLTRVIAALGHLAVEPGPEATATPGPAPAPEPVAPAPTAPSPVPATAPVSAPAPDTGTTADGTDLAAAYVRCRELEEVHGTGPGTLDQLVSGPPAPPAPVSAPEVVAAPAPVATATPVEPVAVPTPTPAPQPAPTVAQEGVTEDEPVDVVPLDDVVPITDLCYRGQSAIDRALSLRAEVRRAVADGDGEGADRLLDEIFDLVQLGLQPTA